MMYLLILVLLLGGGIFLVWRGVNNQQAKTAAAGAALAVGAILFFGLLSFWGEMLWFEAVDYEERFWTVVWARLGMTAGGAVASGLAAFLLTWGLPKQPPLARWWPETLAALYGASWGLANWDTALRWWHRVEAGISDPIFNRDVGFYLFVLPFLDALYSLLYVVAILSLGAALFMRLAPHLEKPAQDRTDLELDWSKAGQAERKRIDRTLYLTAGFFLLMFGFGFVLEPFHLLYSEYGVVSGAGWTDTRIRMPGYFFVGGVSLLLGVGYLAAAAIPKLRGWINNRQISNIKGPPVGLGVPLVFLGIVWAGWLMVVPLFTQWLWVSPNEITVERPYIEYNIQLTRHAFGLDSVEHHEFPVEETLTEDTLSKNQHLLSEVRLWDPRALMATYEQFQEIRLYYEFNDVDIDRYQLEDNYRQVMVSPREMEVDNLPERNQTFVNRRFKYTHGFGATLAPVSDFTQQGLPNLLVKDLPPRSEIPQLQLERPQVYYGEHTDEPVVVNSREKEFDYPRGDQNVYNHYAGRGGVQLSNLWRKFVFGWKFDGTRLFVSRYPTRESRIQFHRSIRERVQTLAPFLKFDRDPYIVLHEGKMLWIVDAYTTSTRFPYSERIQSEEVISELQGVNYVRNSVKAVVDAYEGSVDLYVFEPEDPLIRVWQRIFPTLFKSQEEMPEGLRRHIRYPEGLLRTQGLVYTKYHMADPTVFYNQEDLWVPATEKYYGSVQTVEPYYIMWEPPGANSTEFVLMQPFTPKNRQVMIGWIAGLCDGENYGRLLTYKFPKEKRVLGPQQVETKIDQDRHLSGQLTLWDQRGSRVIRGNLLVIPIDDTLLYVEPIYLQAEDAAYPELRLVAVMHNDRLSYAETFEEALEGLFEDRPPTPPDISPPSTDQRTLAELAAQASDAFDSYLEESSQKNFQAAAEELQRLQETLQRLEELSTETEDITTEPSDEQEPVNQ